jgi:hypothetical protein
VQGEQAGALPGDQGHDERVEGGDLGVEELGAPAQLAQHPLITNAISALHWRTSPDAPLPLQLLVAAVTLAAIIAFSAR